MPLAFNLTCDALWDFWPATQAKITLAAPFPGVVVVEIRHTRHLGSLSPGPSLASSQ